MALPSSLQARAVLTGRGFGQRHKELFGFPHRPVVSHRCQHLIASLIQDKENRLCSKRYHFKDLVSASSAFSPEGSSSARRGRGRSTHQKQPQRGPRDVVGRYVFPSDAEDIKAHKWFRGVPWDRLHELQPPHVPQLHAVDDTHYFDEDANISDWSESTASESELLELPGDEPDTSALATAMGGLGLGTAGNAADVNPGAETQQPSKAEQARVALGGLHSSIQNWALSAIAKPYDATRLRNFDSQVDGIAGLTSSERNFLKQFIRVFGRKERKRPRDRLLRDRATRSVVMKERKKTAFLGYTWRRMRPLFLEEDLEVSPEEEQDGSLTSGDAATVQALGGDQEGWLDVGLDGNGGGEGFGTPATWEDDMTASRNLHRGRMSLR